MRTRVKICGITRAADARAAAQAGADAIGLVFYPPSPRYLSLDQARALRRALPPFVSSIALFVNPSTEEVQRVLETVRPEALQFHGEETPEFCERFGVPYLKACRVRPGVDLLEYLRPYSGASGWLADAYVEAYGGTGTSFDWSVVPQQRPLPLVLSGGLTCDNVGDAIRIVRPWGVDVSSGVESAKGIKDAGKIAAFIEEVRNADG
ncbi:MAG TPA: phosphoribosylanthranilate isomerase [Burkholderiales bacterium]|nr:phosphoribosylanthranilate isomerase [Burkholderiales bacterium]